MGSSAKHDQSLRGLRVLNTRAATGAAALSEPLRALGATVVELPLLAFAPPADWGPAERRWRALAPGDWVVFTSATAVQCLLAHVRELGGAPGDLNVAQVAAIGPGTAEPLRQAGVTVAMVPEFFQGEGLLAALLEQLPPAARVWLPRAETARAVLTDGLRQAGHAVCVTPVYRTVPATVETAELRRLLRDGGVDWIVFTSSSAVRYFLETLGDERPALHMARTWPRVACLGAVTARAAREAGLTVHVQPEQQNIPGLVAALTAYVAAQADGKDRAMSAKASKNAGQTEARLRQLAYQFLVHSFLYYRLGESVIDDPAYDRLTEELRRLREAHPAAEMPHAKLIDPVLGPEASGHQVREYPPEIITLAFQLLYAETHPAVEFEEFVERRGYRVSHEGDPVA